jgi:hypothetical protein
MGSKQKLDWPYRSSRPILAVNQNVVRNMETRMSYTFTAPGNDGASRTAAASAVVVGARPDHFERRDWRKRRKVRARRATELRGI